MLDRAFRTAKISIGIKNAMNPVVNLNVDIILTPMTLTEFLFDIYQLFAKEYGDSDEELTQKIFEDIKQLFMKEDAEVSFKKTDKSSSWKEVFDLEYNLRKDTFDN